jgi:uncharacterized protein YeaO (DUF488 family)
VIKIPLQVYTAQIKYTNLHEIKTNPDCLDITIKSGSKIFAPSWGMVMGHKNLRLSDTQYTQMYYKLMRVSYKNNKKEWEELLAKEKIILMCYCYDGSFCHRYLLRDILVKLGAKAKEEIII